jgi:predicted nucleic acid-binding protein
VSTATLAAVTTIDVKFRRHDKQAGVRIKVTLLIICASCRVRRQYLFSFWVTWI